MAKNFQELNFEISQKTRELRKLDSKILDYVEGVIDEDDFEKVKATRAKLRVTIAADVKKLPAERKKYEAELAALNKEDMEETNND